MDNREIYKNIILGPCDGFVPKSALDEDLEEINLRKEGVEKDLLKTPGAQSVQKIIDVILSQIRENTKKAVVEAIRYDEQGGRVIISLKPQAKEDDIRLMVTAISILTARNKIKITREDRGLDDNPGDGEIPKTPVLGPPKGPPTLEAHEELAGNEFLQRDDILAGDKNGWGISIGTGEDRQAAARRRR